MGWFVTIPGQPPTLNDLYTVVPRTSKDGRRYTGIGKNPKARQYHDDVLWTLRAAKPSRWMPEGDFRIKVRLFLRRSIDTDNTLKVLSDAVQSAIGIDDSRFLWCIVSREIDPKLDPHVELEFCDDASHT